MLHGAMAPALDITHQNNKTNNGLPPILLPENYMSHGQNLTSMAALILRTNLEFYFLTQLMEEKPGHNPLRLTNSMEIA